MPSPAASKRVNHAQEPLVRRGWPPAFVHAIRHSTLPGPAESTDSAVPLDNCSEWGLRDRTSLLVQYAGHRAFLRHAEIRDSEFNPGDWLALRQRGQDCRLIRVNAPDSPRELENDEVFPLSSAARFLGVENVASLTRTWTRPEDVFIELFQRLTSGASADLRWSRSSATGLLQSPGIAFLERLLAGQSVTASYVEVTVPDVVMRAMTEAKLARRIVRLGRDDASPLRPWSALRPLEAFIGDFAGKEATIPERTGRAFERDAALLMIENYESFDLSSQRALRSIAKAGVNAAWMVPEIAAETLGLEAELIPLTSLFCVAPSVTALADLRKSAGSGPAQHESYILELTRPGVLEQFLESSRVPAINQLISVTQPHRSFLSVLAILGISTPRAVAAQLLATVSTLNIDDLVFDGITSSDRDAFTFLSRDAHQMLRDELDEGTRRALTVDASRLLYESGELASALRLMREAGRQSEAVTFAEETLAVRELSEDELSVAADILLASVDRSQSPLLFSACSTRLLAEGRYETLLRLTGGVDGENAAVFRSQALCRLGRYAEAIVAIGDYSSADALLHRGSAERLDGRVEAARQSLERADETATGKASASIAFQRALIEIDHDEPVSIRFIDAVAADECLSQRLTVYRSLASSDFPVASRSAEQASLCARSLPEKIDAALDHLYVRFMRGEWEEARHESRGVLALIEESEGDRAAGGVLFTLAYLCADAGQFEQAERWRQRMARFFSSSGDRRREAELRLIAAQSAYRRGDHETAGEEAARLLSEAPGGDIAVAAELIVADLNGRLPTLATTCLELFDRQQLLRARAGSGALECSGSFNRELLTFEARKEPVRSDFPRPSSATDELKLLRSIEVLTARSGEATLLAELDALRARHGISARMKVAYVENRRDEAEVLLQLTLADFPFDHAVLGERGWRHVTRNRLGDYHETGPLQPLGAEALIESVLDGDRDWLKCSESMTFYLQGSAAFSPQGRSAIGALIRLRTEHFNQSRALSQDHSVSTPVEQIDGLLGNSLPIRELVAKIPRVARGDVAVCIIGETGTGKELIASAIHRHSGRRAKKFTAINCAALPENLIESELFGAVRGAYTGADRDRIGLIEATHEGTLFLDEIGELPLAAQAKVLRFLQDGEYRRVGDSQPRSADVRIVAATNRRLEEMVDEGGFREDLYYRIRGVELFSPPLRDRGADVLLLARHFLAVQRDRHRGGPALLSEDVEAAFCNYRWPGNVRELQNTVRAGHTMAGDLRAIELDHIPERISSTPKSRIPTGNYQVEVVAFRRTLIERTLAESKGNQSRAAKLLGMSRQALAYQIRELGIAVK